MSRISQPVASRAVCRELGTKLVDHFVSTEFHDNDVKVDLVCMNTQTGEMFIIKNKEEK
jgi:hypothetical protein